MISMRNARQMCLAAAFLMVIGLHASTFAATSGTDPDSDDDTYMRSNSTGAPGGTSPNTPKERRLEVGNWGGTYESRALIHFDLTQFTGLALGSTVSNATLKISYFNNSAPTGDVANKLKVYRVTNSWQGGDSFTPTANVGASWDQRYLSTDPKWTTNGGDYTGTGIVPSVATAPATNAVVEWDVTSIVNAWINGGATNYGFIIISDLDSGAADYYLLNEGADYATSPGATLVPKLNVTYTSVTSTTLAPSQDCGIRASQNNLGGDPLVWAAAGTENILLKFPLSSIPSNTQVAKLRMRTANGGQGGTGIVSAYKLTQTAWTEGTGIRGGGVTAGADWFTYDGTNAWTTNGGDYDNSRAFNSPSTTIAGTDVDVTFDIDVSALVVEAQAATPTGTVDFLLVPGTGCDWRLGSKEYVGSTPPAPRSAQLIVSSTSAALPSITVPTPATVTSGASQTITWTYAGGTMTTFNVYLGDGTTFKKINGAAVAGTSGNGSFTWTVDTTGLISPPASTYVVKIVEATKLFQKVSGTFTINPVPSPLAISTASLTSGTRATAYGPVSLTATGGSGGNTWAATGLPSGMTLSAGGSLSGTPTAAGVYTVVVSVTDSTPTTVNKTLSLTINPAVGDPVIAATVPPNPVINTPYDFTFSVSGGTGTLTYSATGLPTGLTINTATGQVTGTPTALGSSTWSITVTDTVPVSYTRTFTVSVVAAAGTGKKGGCDFGGGSSNAGFLALLLAAGMLTVVVRRSTVQA